MKAVWFASAAVGLGLGLAFSAAGCSDAYCPNGASAGAGGTGCADTAASGGTTSVSTCPLLTATKACLTTFCKSDGADTPFCNCFLKGYDLSAPNTDTNGNETGCACVAPDDAAFCANPANDPDSSTVDCSVASGSVASMCVGVQ